MSAFFEIDERLTGLADKALSMCEEQFKAIDAVTAYNQEKVLKAFIKNNVSERHFNATTGYGYGDEGRETLDKVFADCVGAESSIFSHAFASGTHTICVALFGLLRPGDRMLCLAGKPYDTLVGVLGIGGECDGSLKDFAINCDIAELGQDDKPDVDTIAEKLSSRFYKVAYIQRSRGYSLRPSLKVVEIAELCRLVKSISPETIIVVDNCYGEFVESTEPTNVGADIIIGSLIKNPGGGIAPMGGYIAGKSELVEKCSYRLTAPGVGREIGATLGHNRELFMGLFSAPHVTGEALKTACFTAAFFELLGFKAIPSYSEKRADIVQSVLLKNAESLIAFCQGMQSGAPVDAFVTPEPWAMPGYDCDVIMAAGAFIGGSSIELSADAPLREPYAAWMQGGINFHSAKLSVMLAAQSMLKKGKITL